ncbi:hypothetical protein BpHYR1_049106 [Brachionus plicatilis]|uniref:Uncharacterized protein n=1 Tax=Brachionus plicatilis TaxID=10195 RepID=A0A3M7QXN5_BRAPC|nr:hypothetical protein BpHYR1_049106 [Brachionus plicatilis]
MNSTYTAPKERKTELFDKFIYLIQINLQQKKSILQYSFHQDNFRICKIEKKTCQFRLILSITTTPTLFNLHVYSFTVQYYDLMRLASDNI